MSLESSQCDVQVEENEDLRATPELRITGPAMAEGNGESNCTQIKSEPPDNQASEENVQTQMPASAMQVMDTNAVLKADCMNEEVDYNMPIGKTPLNDRDQICDMGDQADMPRNEQLNATSAKIALDEYMDGLATPLMPRLRVKSELELQETAQRQASNENSYSMDTENLPPPPPPIFSSNSNSNFVADGIATPRLSLVATNRLRVKTELAIPPPSQSDRDDEDALPVHADNFDDLIGIRVPTGEPGEISPSVSGDDSDDEPIPEGFFDDLLHDKLQERIELAQNNELEEKYSDRLKEHERLKNEFKAREKHKKSKKQKKSKKKSRKRSRSRSVSPNGRANERNLNNLSNNDRNKRSRVLPPDTEMASTSNHAHRELNDKLLRVNSGFKVKTEYRANDLENTSKGSAPSLETVEEVEEHLTPIQKREKAIKRATDLLKYIKETSAISNNIFSKFLFVSTVRKLPTSHSYVQQRMYENRSPLHTVNNVSYKFNSHTTRFNMEEWGLAVLPPNAAEMAKRIGCSAEFIHNKLKTIRIPANLRKVKQEPNREAENELDEETLIETSSSLYSNAMTQTDNISEFGLSRKEKGYDIGVQVEPSVYSIGCQTLETQSPTENVHKDDEAPIMKIIHNLNENQLMAIHAFAELIREPNASDNAMEMYKIQMKILEIYKMSQIPSALVTAQPPIVNNYTTMTTKAKNQSPICIKSVTGADGVKFSINDPRSRSAAYAKRTCNDDVNSSSSHDSRYSASHAPNVRYSGHEGFSPMSHSRSSGSESRHYSNNSPTQQRYDSVYRGETLPHTTKHYGRGGLRR